MTSEVVIRDVVVVLMAEGLGYDSMIPGEALINNVPMQIAEMDFAISLRAKRYFRGIPQSFVNIITVKSSYYIEVSNISGK